MKGIFMNSFIVSDALRVLENERVKFYFTGNDSLLITHPRSFDLADNNCVCFSRNDSIDLPEKIPEALIILKENHPLDNISGTILLVENPDLCFCIVASLLLEKAKPGCHETAVISTHAKVEKEVSIGAFTFIGDNVHILDGVSIGSSCVVDNAVIGRNTTILSGVKIGSPGLGSNKDIKGQWHDFPHFGRVIIGDNVVIQDNTVVNRGNLNDTIIKNGVRIGPLCWIAHGVCIGRDAFLAQGVTVAGSVNVDENSLVWGNASIRDGITIGKGSEIGMGSVVTKDIPGGETWAGNPAKFLKEHGVK